MILVRRSYLITSNKLYLFIILARNYYASWRVQSVKRGKLWEFSDCKKEQIGNICFRIIDTDVLFVQEDYMEQTYVCFLFMLNGKDDQVLL